MRWGGYVCIARMKPFVSYYSIVIANSVVSSALKANQRNTHVRRRWDKQINTATDRRTHRARRTETRRTKGADRTWAEYSQRARHVTVTYRIGIEWVALCGWWKQIAKYHRTMRQLLASQKKHLLFLHQKSLSHFPFSHLPPLFLATTPDSPFYISLLFNPLLLLFSLLLLSRLVPFLSLISLYSLHGSSHLFSFSISFLNNLQMSLLSSLLLSFLLLN